MRIKTALKRDEFFIALISLCIFVFAIVRCNVRSIPYVYNDEYGYWASAAYFAGWDWSEVFSSISFYSYGYGLVLGLLLFVTRNPYLAYHLAIVLNGVWMALSFLFLYKSQVILYPNKSQIIRILPPLLATLYASNIAQINYTWPECFLFFLFCLVFYLLVNLEHKENWKSIIALSLVLPYSYAVHQRTLGVSIAAIIALVVLVILRKVSWKKLVAFLGIWVALLFAASQVKEIVIDNVWNNASAVIFNNFGGQVGKLSHILTLKGFLDLVYSFIGKLFYLVIATAFLALNSFIASSVDIFDNIRNKDTKKTGINVFMILAILGTVGISAISLVIPYNISHLVYGRYTDNVLGPYIMVGLTELITSKNAKKVFKLDLLFAFICTVIVLIAFQTNTLQYQAAINNIGIAKYISNTDMNVFSLFMTAALLIITVVVVQNSHLKQIVKSIIEFSVIVTFFVITGWQAYEKFEIDWSAANESSRICADKIEELSKTHDLEIYALMGESGYPSRFTGNGVQYALGDRAVHVKLLTYLSNRKYHADDEIDYNLYIVWSNSITSDMRDRYYVYNCNQYSLLVDLRNTELVKEFPVIEEEVEEVEETQGGRK